MLKAFVPELPYNTNKCTEWMYLFFSYITKSPYKQTIQCFGSLENANQIHSKVIATGQNGQANIFMFFHLYSFQPWIVLKHSLVYWSINLNNKIQNSLVFNTLIQHARFQGHNQPFLY